MIDFIISRPGFVIILVLLISLIFAFGLRNGLELDASALGFIERTSREKEFYEAARKNFGPDDYLAIAVVCDDIFAPRNLEKLRKLHNRVSEIRELAEVVSLINIPYARSFEGGASLERLIPEKIPGPERLREIRAVATRDRIYAGNLVSPDSRTAALNILLDNELPTEQRHRIVARVYELTREAGFDEYYLAGDPFSQWRGTESIKRDLRIFLPLTMILIAFLLWLSFRSMVAVVLPLMTIGIGLLWLLGLMGYLNARFTILALMLPTLMLAIGCSYMIHVINQVGIQSELMAEEMESRKILAAALRFISVPVIVSALTIIAGFLSLAFTRIPAVRETAVYAALGAAFTMILSLTFIPAMLVILPRRMMAFRVGLGGAMVRLLERTGHWATSNQKTLYALTAIILAISVIGMWRIVIDIDYFHFFKPQSETSISLAEINRRLSGAITFDVVIDGRRAGAIEHADMLGRIEQLQRFAEEQKDATGLGVDRTLSVVDFMKHLNQAFHENDPSWYRIPEDDRIVAELLSDRDQLRAFLSNDARIARILVRSNLSSSQAMDGAIHAIERRARELFPDCDVAATGTLVLLNRTSDRIARDQVLSISIALVTIYLMLSILFRSLRVGLTALVPNLIPVLFFFGYMGWQGIELNLTTSLVASVVLGLAVDNSVQFIVRFRRMQREHDGLRVAIIQSMRLSGRPIIYANVALAVAFAIFAFSDFKPVGSFGLLSAVTIIGCLIEDLVLLPARLTSPVFRAH
ncbi:MAG: MMPL family transporter [Acidobacteriota bacterium]|nr:MAG: MMPL family transporter [Acidobacteriota bacterium]